MIRGAVSAALVAVLLADAAQVPPSLALEIREGRDAVNDIRSRKAVAPAVVVRDETGRPVGGAEVTFELPDAGPGGAFHGWMRAQTVRTDAQGQAAPSGYAPNAEAGDFEIRVSARSDGRTGSVGIPQSNGPAPARVAGPVRVKRKSRTPLLILMAANTGMMAVIAARSLRRDSGSAAMWVYASMAAGSVAGVVALAGTKQRAQSDRFATAAGPVEAMPIHHAALMLRSPEAVVYIDPTSQVRYRGMPKADLVLITDNNRDQFDPVAIRELMRPGAAVYGPAGAARATSGITALGNGEKVAFRGWQIEAVPAYNLPGSDAPGRVFHEKGVGNGYLLAFGGTRFLVAGNTGSTPELRALRHVDVAFLPMNPPYTMSGEDAASAVREFRPRIVYPYHYRGCLLEAYRFKKALEDTPIEVRVRNWYP